jgi:hypothetical protein
MCKVQTLSASICTFLQEATIMLRNIDSTASVLLGIYLVALSIYWFVDFEIQEQKNLYS